MILVTVVIPCLNVAKYIADAINSCLSQDYSNIEIICVDNGSTDETVSIISAFSQVKLIYEKQRGAPFARNRGLLEANGEWIQFLDADDLLDAKKIKHQMDLVACNVDAACVAAAYTRQKISGANYATFFENEDIWLGLLRTQIGITSSNLWRRDKVIDCGGWNLKLQSSQEYELMFRLLKEGNTFILDDKINTTVRDRESGAISQGKSALLWKNYVNLRVEILQFLKSRNVNQKKWNEYLLIVLGQIRILYQHDKQDSQAMFMKLLQIAYPNKLPSNSLYLLLLKVFGFSRLQHLLGKIGRS